MNLLIAVVSDSDHSTSEKSTATIPFSSKPSPAKKRTKNSIKIKKTAAFSKLPSTPAKPYKDIIPLLQVFKVAPPTPVRHAIVSPAPPPKSLTSQSSCSSVLIALRSRDGLVIRDPLPETTRSGFKAPVSTDKGKEKMHALPEDYEYVGPKSFSKQQLIFRLLE